MFVALASVFVGTSAFAAADPASLPDDVAKHLFVTMVAGLMPAVTKMLSDSAPRFWTIPAPARVFLIGVVSILATAIEEWGKGANLPRTLMVLAASSLPSLMVELVQKLGKKPEFSSRPPPA